MLQIFADPAFGTPHLTNSRLCQQWNCINTKLGLPNSLPPREQFDIALRSLLPEGEWQDVVNKVLDTCYGHHPRMYTNSCPGQALLHCAVENLIENCPESSQSKHDSCTPLNSIAGVKYLFSQSRYINLEENLPKERRPAWFLKNYFSTKCCDLPHLFNITVLSDCGLRSVITYYEHGLKPKDYFSFGTQKVTTPNPIDAVKIVNPGTENNNSPQDPLDCCDMSTFIQPSWRSECDFQLNWEGENRLSIRNSTRSTAAPPVTTTVAPLQIRETKVLPHSCEKETCVFNKLNMLTASGDVNFESFTKLLDNFTKSHEQFTKAKARVITECLTKPLLSYEGECQINKVLACTFDVLSENCPYYDKKRDPCKNPTNGMSCQISSSRYRAKNRRTICHIPSLVPHMYLAECGLASLSQMITDTTVLERGANKKHSWSITRIGCQDATESTTCLMNKMGILNKYNFMDYFKMKDRIRKVTSSEPDWTLMNIYISAFTNTPLYKQHCNSPKKLLNVIDAMLMTCPMPRRKNTLQCNRIFEDLTHLAPNYNMQRIHNSTLIFGHTLTPLQNAFVPFSPLRPRKYAKVLYKPLYNFGVLASGSAPPVTTIDVPKPSTEMTTRIPARLPVYMLLRVNRPNLTPLSPFGTNTLLRQMRDPNAIL